MRKTSTPSKFLAFVLAVVMAVGATPVNAFAMEIDTPIDAATGNGWEIIDGTQDVHEHLEVTESIPKTETSQTEGTTEESGSSSSTPTEEAETNTPVTPPENTEDSEVPPNEENQKPQNSEEKAENEDKKDLSEHQHEESGNAPEGTELPWAVNFDESMEALSAMPMLFSDRNQRASDVTYRKEYFGSNKDQYIWIGSKDHGGYFLGFMDFIKYRGQDAFCGEFNGKAPGGSYDDGVEGRSQKIKQIIACYEASDKSKGDYIAAQALIWAELLGKSVTQWGTSGANEDLLGIDADSDDITYRVIQNLDSPHTQNLIIYDTDGPEESQPYAIKIIKKNADGSKVISGATFTVEGPDGFKKTELRTNSKGEIFVGVGKTGEYTVTETNPPVGYKLSDPNVKTVDVTRSNKSSNPAVVEFRNEIDDEFDPEGDPSIKVETHEETETVVEQSKEYEYSDAIGQITIRKHDQDGNSLDSALFNILVEFTDGSSLLEENWEVDNGARLFTWTHPVDNHDPAKVTVTEVQPPLHYEGDPTPKTVTVSPTFTRVTHVTSWTITITTTTTNVTIIGEEGETIDENTSTATASTRSDPQVEEFTDFIAGDREITVTFVNQRETGDIIVTKRDANTGAPLAGAQVHLWGEDLGNPHHIDKTLVTDSNGEAIFDFLPPGTYAIQETQAPFGYNLNDEIQNAVLQSNQVLHKEIRDYRKDGLVIKKVDENGNPLPGATFELRRGSGEVLLREVTNENGIIFRDHLTDDTYVIEEIKAPEGYLLDEDPVQDIRIFEEDDNKEYVVTFVNKKKPAIEITKVDGLDTDKKLAGAVFRIVNTRTNHYWDVTTGEDGKALLEGLEIDTTYRIRETKAPEGYMNSGYDKDIVLKECRTHTVVVENFENPGLRILKMDADTREPLIGAKFKIEKPNGELIGQPVTDKDGLIFVHGLDAGTVIVTEIQAPNGYILDSTPHTVNLISGKQVSLELTNVSKPGLQIIKRDKLTDLPIAGARFSLTYLADGGKKELGIYTTGESGTVFVPNLKPGYYVVREVEAAPGYILDPTPHNVEVVGGELNCIDLYNTPYSDLKIVKIDAENGKPLEGAVFKIFDAERKEIATRTTSEQGEIFLHSLPSGMVYIQEAKAPAGYLLDNTVKQAELVGGKTTIVEVKNVPLGSLSIKKIDSVTHEPLYGATFNLYDSRNNLLGEYTTNQNGMITFGRALKNGVYKLKEVKAPAGYVLDETVRTVRIRSDETTEIIIENEPMTGKIQIVKVASEQNRITGDSKGELLEGAVFEIFDESLRMVDKIKTDSHGIATSKDLPLGKYVIREVEAPEHYLKDSRNMYAEIKVSDDLIRFRVENSPEKLDVSIQKHGINETMSGEVIRYTLSNIANNSNCSLDDFYWRDILPTSAIRIKSVRTGTYNEYGTYDLWVRTNRHNWYCVEDDLHTNVDYDIDLSSRALDLSFNEYVTEIKMEFGTVAAGFHSESDPVITAYVREGLPKGYRISNTADVGGCSEGKWVYNKDRWVTVIYKETDRKLPQTGGPNFFERFPEYKVKE